tara:strand:+ start:89 stop:466 length:378 start_codon:yes stop_codon:yes gene_type:complete
MAKHRAERCDEQTEGGEWFHTWDVTSPTGESVHSGIRTRKEARELAREYDSRSGGQPMELKLTFNAHGAILSDKETRRVTHSLTRPMWEIEGSKWGLHKYVGLCQEFVGSFASVEDAKAHAEKTL